MKRPRNASVSSSNDSDDNDSEEELQEAFEKGLLKPGLNVAIERTKKERSNNVADMKLKIESLRLDLPWIETLDSIDDPAPMAPEVARQLEETTQRQMNIHANNAKLPKLDIKHDPIVNEFTRENLFHRQAQAAILKAIPRLHSMDVVTKRPEIYFAEMAKSDSHMQKIRQNLMAKQAGRARAEKVRQMRQQKKMGKQIKTQTKLNRQTEKKAALNEIKKYRRGARDRDDSSANDKNVVKRKMKDKKFGFGGKKKGSKLNTKESSADFADLRRPNKSKGAFKSKHKANSNSKKSKRPGKSRRVNFKSKNKK